MLVVAAVLAVLAGLLHVFIWVLESLRWEDPSTRARFGTTPEQAAQTKELAFNQGFYNLFLALITFAGVILLDLVREDGVALLIAGPGAMLGAAIVLVARDRSRLRAGVIQGTLPLLTLLALLLWAI
jgi:putative membrane protein